MSLQNACNSKEARLSQRRAFLAQQQQQQLRKDGIRLNAVAPGPIWTSLIPAIYMTGQVLHPNGGEIING